MTLTASTGALVLFAAVQATIIAGAIAKGERPRALEWCGLALALAGLTYLTLPGLSAPPLAGSMLMLAAGVAWGLYTLRGRGSASPLLDTARNFACAVPAVVIVALAMHTQWRVSRSGILYAAASGVLASGLGYVAWYAALHGLSAARAAMVQLAVPVIAALGAVLFLSEQIGMRLVVSTGLILGGIALALTRRSR